MSSSYPPLSIDMIYRVLANTLLHPFITFLIPLCLRARTVKWDAPLMIAAFVWAALINTFYLLSMTSHRFAYGLPREVDLSEEVIVITGGARGVGGLVAEVYGMRGANVAVLDVCEMEDAEAKGVNFYKCDVGKKEEVLRVAKKVEQDLGLPTVLINNAAIVIGKSFVNLSIEEIDASLQTNLLGAFYCLKAFLPSLIRSPLGGTIVNVSSVIGRLGAAQLTDYAAAKAGIIALHRSLSSELRDTHPDIKTVLITPGQLSTPLFYGVRTPNRFMAPVVEPVDVCKEIVAAIDAGKGAAIAMPLYAKLVSWYEILPAGLQLLARKIAGVDQGMKTFQGRDGLGSVKEKAL